MWSVELEVVYHSMAGNSINIIIIIINVVVFLILHSGMLLVPCRASVLSSGTLGAAMEASLAHKKAIAISFPFNGWGSWTEDDIQTAVQVRPM